MDAFKKNFATISIIVTIITTAIGGFMALKPMVDNLATKADVQHARDLAEYRILGVTISMNTSRIIVIHSEYSNVDTAPTAIQTEYSVLLSANETLGDKRDALLSAGVLQ